jgi:L-ascorbate metabolism protein UlaG (beta-lactamase superfamily)
VSPRELKHLRRVSEGFLRPIAAAPHKPDPSTWADDRLSAAWLGHSTVLLNFFGVHAISDPALRNRVGVGAGPVTVGPKRFIAPALRIRELPRLDLILLTHAHMDHMDMGTLKRMRRDVTVVTAKDTADLLAGMRFKHVVELGWGSTTCVSTPHGTVTIEAFRPEHWGARVRTDLYRGFNAYLLERNGHRVCFAGDTAQTNFSAAGRRGPVDLMVMPIGAYNPWIRSHCTPEQAVEMADQARARFVMPVHHQTFRLGVEPMGEPIQRFVRSLAPDRVALREIGETFVLP